MGSLIDLPETPIRALNAALQAPAADADEVVDPRGAHAVAVGPMSAFTAQAGRLVVCSDAGEALGDSVYEARFYFLVPLTVEAAAMARVPLAGTNWVPGREESRT